MVWQVLFSLLLNVNGKLDCKVLLKVDVVVCCQVGEFLWEGFECLVVVIWEVLFGVEGIVCDEYFFEFGGYFFSVIWVVLCLCQDLELDVFLCILFEWLVLVDFVVFLEFQVVSVVFVL